MAGQGHVVLVGCGRVGSRVAAGLLEAGERVTIVEMEAARDALPDEQHATLVIGNAAHPAVLERAGIATARMLFVATPATYEAGRIVEEARRRNPRLRIVARTHADAEGDYLKQCGADRTIMGEREIARVMVEEALADAG